MIYDSKCTNEKCPHPSIGAGVRFNATKKTVGKYLETISIYEFKMKCPACKSEIVIRTDPKSCDYIYVSGIKKLFSEYLDSKKKERFEMSERAAAREGLSLNEKVKLVDQAVNSKNKWAIANIDIGK